MIKVITFDFWNTLFDSSGGVERNAYRLNVLDEQMAKIGMRLPYAQYEAAMKVSWEYFSNEWKTHHHTPSAEESVAFIWDYFKAPHNDDAMNTVADAFADCILHYPPALIGNVKEIIETLKEKYILGVVSDTGFSPGTILRKLLYDNGIFNSFKAFSFSNETGVAKPHPKAFLTILEQLDCPPHQALHIGDIEETDITGAKSLGIKAVRFSGDTEAYQTKKYTEPTKADAEIFDWKELLNVIEEMEKKK